MSRRAIVLGSVDVGESSRIVRMLTPDEGRVAVMVRQARSSKRRFAGLLDPGTRLEITTRRGRGDLPLLQEASLVHGVDRPRSDLLRLTLVAYGCEVIAGLSPENQASPKLHRLLEVWLDLLEEETPPTVGSRIAFEAKALTFAGLAPATVVCAVCGLRVEDPCVFDAGSGGALHRHCGAGREVAWEQLLLFEALRRTPLAETLEPHPVEPSVAWLFSDFIVYQLGKELKSRRMLETL